MNPTDIDYSEKVMLLQRGAREEMSLAEAINSVMRSATLSDRLASTIIRNGSPMPYSEIMRISGRRDFPRHG